MIPCVEVRRHLMDFHYNLLPDWEAEEIRLHLEGCPGCRTENVRVRQGIAQFDGWRVAGPARGVKGSFARRMKTELNVSLRRPSLRERLVELGNRPLSLRPFALAGLAAFLIWGGGWVYNATRPVLNLETYTRDYQLILHDPAVIQFGGDNPRIASLWLSRNEEFTSHAPALDRDRFRLRGVRVNRLQGQPVAVWVYRRDSETALLFERPDDGAKLPHCTGEVDVHTHQFDQVWEAGLNLLTWKADGRIFTAVSPMDAEALAWVLCHCIDAANPEAAALAQSAPLTCVHNVRKPLATD
jgi:anti-sigma factor RsiW